MQKSRKWPVVLAVLLLAILLLAVSPFFAARFFMISPTEQEQSVIWEYEPLLSSKLPAFPFTFNLPYSAIEAECDNGTLIGYDDHDGTAYPQGKQLTIPNGSTLYWTPQTEESEDFSLSAEITFTVYDGNDTLYTGTISISSEKVQDSPTNATYSATLDEDSGLSMEQAIEINGKEMEGAIITTPIQPLES